MITGILALCASLAFGAPTAEGAAFSDLRREYDKGPSARFSEMAVSFSKNYPGSRHIPEVLFMQAETETSPERAVSLYDRIIGKYPSFAHSDLVRLRKCEVLYLSGKWEPLIRESGAAFLAMRDSRYRHLFGMMLARAYLYVERYEEARRTCESILASHRDGDDLSEVQLMIAWCEKKESGNSSGYIAALRSGLERYPGSPAYPAFLYLLGRYHESAGDTDRAFTAYEDLRVKYPRSPDSVFAAGRSEGLARLNPVRKDYMPTDAMLGSAEGIDLRPGANGIDDSPGDTTALYAVALGPFPTKADALSAGKIIRGDFAPLRLVSVAGRHLLYVGKYTGAGKAMTARIRLAEEYGINGTIVRMKKEGPRQYIYGE